MAQGADIKLLIGAAMTSADGGNSAALIRETLQKALSGNNGIKVSVRIDEKSKQDIAKQIRGALQDINVSLTPSSAGTSKATDTLKSEVASVNNLFTKIGNIKKEINRITLELSKTDSGTSKAAGLRNELALQLQYRKQYGAELGKIISKNPQVLNDAKKHKDYLEQTAKSTANLATATGELADKHRNSLLTALKKEREEQEKNNVALQGSIDKCNKIQSQFNTYTKNINPRAIVEFKDDVDDIFLKLKNGDAEEAAKAFEIFRMKVKDAGYEGGNAFTYFHSKVKSFMTYLASSAFTMLFVVTFRNAKQAVLDLNKALVDLRMVTGGSVAQTERLIKQYNKMAQELGVTTTAITEAAVGWQRQGYNLEDTETLIRNSTILAKVGFLDAADAQQYLTSMMKGYQISVEDSLSIVDKLAAVDTSAAVSAGGLAEAISKTANSARLAGVDLDTLIGYLAAVGEVTQQDMSSLGNAFKTMFARYSNVKLGKLEDDEGESLNDYETVLNSIGIALRNAKGEFRDFGEVWDEVVSKYAGLDNVTQSAIAQALGSTRQREGVLTLLDNIDNAAKYTEISLNSAGVAMEKFGAYEEGLEAKAAGMKAAFEGAAKTIVPEGLISLVYDAGTGLARLISIGDGLPTQLLGIAAAILAVNSAYAMLKASTVKDLWVKFIKGAADFGKGLVSLPKLLMNAAKGTQSFGDGLKAMGVSASTAQIAISALTAAISIGIILYQRHKQKVEEDRQAMEDAARSANEERESLSSLINEYKRLAESGNIDKGSREAVKNLQQQITDLVGDQADNLDLVNGKLDDQIAKLDEIAYKTAKDNAGALELKWEDATEDFTNGIGNSTSVWNPLIPDDGFIDTALKKLQEHGVAIDEAWSYALHNGGREINFQSGLEDKDAREVLEEYKKLQELLRENRDIWSADVDSHMFNSSKDVLAGIQEQIDLYQGIVDTYNSATKDYFANEAIIEQWEYLKKNSINTQDAFDAYVVGINNSTDKSEEYKNALLDLATKTYPAFAAAAGLVTNSVEDSGSELNNQTGTINSLKTALAGLSDETTVLRDAIKKIGNGKDAFDTWIKADDNLKSLLDKFPDLRDEIEKYDKGLITSLELQEAFNNSLTNVRADDLYAEINDVVSAYENYGANSNQVLQAVQNLEQYLPWLTDALYNEEGGLNAATVAALGSSDALYKYCAGLIEAEYQAKNFDLSNLREELAGAAAMSSVAAMSIEKMLSGKQLDAYTEYTKQMALLDEAWGHHKNVERNKKSSKDKDVYVPDVDPLYQYLQTVEDINDELNDLDIDEKLLNEDDFEGKNKLIKDRIAKLEELKTALHELNDARDVEMSTAVDKLNGYGGFQATYDKESGQALINNMDALKGLTGDTAKAAEELISTIENGSKAALSTSKEYMEALIEQNGLLKEQKELQDQKAEEQADDELERIKNRIARLQNRQDVFATNIDHQNVMHDLGEEKRAYQEMIDLAVRRGAELRAAGAENDDPELAKWSQTYFEGLKGMRDTNRKMVDEILKPYDEFISNADTYSWWDNLDDTKADVLSEKLAKIHDMYKTGLIPDAEMYKELVNETAEALYKEQLDAIDQTIEYTEELIKKEHELREKELEEQKSDYRAIVDAKKESLRASKEEADYQKSVAEKVKAISELQQQINTLSLSDDRRDIAERKKLEEELAQLQGELSDTQADHTLSAQEDALDKSYEAFEKEKDDEIKVVKAEVDTVGKVYALAIDRINSGWDDLYKDLAEWNRNYADGIKGEDGLEGAWKTAKSAASEYFDVLDARQGLEKKYVSASGGNMAVGDTDVYKDKYGLDWDTHKTVQEKANQMRSNSNAWHAANSAGNTYLADTYVSKNESLVKEIESLIGKKLYRDGDGVWHINDGQGTQLYKVYHRGGIVGSNEEFAKVEKGELVVPKEHVNPTMKMLEWGNSLASKMRGLFSGGGLVSSAMSDAIKGAPLSPAAGAIVNNNAPSLVVNAPVEVKYDSSANPADAKKFGENITAGIVEAFHRKGIGTGATPLLTGI